MSELRHAQSFRDLVVYEKAENVSRKVFELSKSFPKEETFSLTDQIRRAVRSIGAQIAEAWAKRRYPKHFVSKLSDADAELQETQHWLSEAHACGYIDQVQSQALIAELEQIGRMLNSMIQKAHLFCDQSRDVVREDSASYFVRNTDH
jgi:four helix bundle protein